MLQVYRTDETTKKLNTIDIATLNESFDLSDCWLHLSNPTDKEIEFVSSLTTFPEEMLKSALDEEERAHIDQEDGVVLTLFDIPMMEEAAEEDYYVYSTIPMGFIHNDKTVVTVTLCEQTILINNFVNGRIKNFSTANRHKFLIQLFYSTATKYLQYLRQIDKSSLHIQNELHIAMKNKELIQLLGLENSLVYFSTSLRANASVMERSKRLFASDYNEEDDALWEDVLIENGQAIEMCNIYRDILSGTMDAFASVISNNLNILMKTLTIITFLISIPTLFASFFGMNTGVPWQGENIGFWLVAIISIVVCIVAGLILFHKPKKK